MPSCETLTLNRAVWPLLIVSVSEGIAESLTTPLRQIAISSPTEMSKIGKTPAYRADQFRYEKGFVYVSVPGIGDVVVSPIDILPLLSTVAGALRDGHDDETCQLARRIFRSFLP